MKHQPMSTPHKLSVPLVALAAILLLGGMVSAWTGPTGSPPNNNVSAPLNVGDTAQTKSGGLLLNTGGATNGLIVASGNVGIGTTSPAGTLDVAGDICISGDCQSSWAGVGNSNLVWGSIFTEGGGSSNATCPDGSVVVGVSASCQTNQGQYNNVTRCYTALECRTLDIQ